MPPYDRSVEALLSRDRSPDRAKVLAEIQRSEAHGLTCDEVERLLRLRHQNASARINELMHAGRIVDSGRKRPTRSGRQATVWVGDGEPVEPPPLTLL